MHRFCGALLPLLLLLCNFNPVYLRKISQPDCLPGLSENEFAFEGNGYVALENRGFEPTQFSQIEFSFKTSVDEGLVYFTITPDGHFESLELRNGKVVYQFQVNSSLVEMATEKHYDDGNWHVLEVWWSQEKSSLVIDDNVESVAGYPEHFKSLNYKSAVYFGGFKGQHNIGGITAKGFNGSIKDVQLGGTSRRLSMHTEMKNARSGCPRRWRRQADPPGTNPAEQWPDFQASYIGSTNIELRWNTTVTNSITTSCYESFVIQWRKLQEANETTETNEHNYTTVTDYLVEIDELQPNTIYTFLLFGKLDREDKLLKTANYSTLNDSHPSLIVTNVTSSSLSVRWKHLNDFVVSLSGNSANISETNGTNYIFENLKPGSIYDLKLFDKQNNISSERKVATIPQPVSDVGATASDTDIDLKWMGSPNVEVMYRKQGGGTVEGCKLKTFSGTSGKISDLSYGCMYKLDVYAVSGARRIGGIQTIDVGINAKQTENFTCNAGVNEGQINCEWKPRPHDACFTYHLTFSPSERIIDRLISSKVTVEKLIPGSTYSISIQSIAGNGNSTDAEFTNATAKTGIQKQFLENMKSTTNSITLQYFKDDERVIDYYNVTSNETSYLLNDTSTPVVLKNLEAGLCYSFTAYAVSQDISSENIDDDICTVPNPPSSVECMDDRATINSVVVAIVKPKAGFVHHYNVGVTSFHIIEPRISHAIADADIVNAVIDNLRPYTYYDIRVVSVLKDGKKKSSKKETRCQTAEGIPGNINAFYNTTFRSDSVRFEWHKPIPENGIIKLYIIYIDPEGLNRTIEVPGSQQNWDINDLDDYAGKRVTFLISAATKAGRGPLKSATVTLKEKDSQALFIVLAFLLAILFMVLIALLVFYYIRKSPQRMMSMRQLSNRIRHPTDQIAMFPQPSVTSKSIKLSEFLECVKLLERDSGLKFTEEYEDLKYVGRNQNRDEAELQCNRVKNRFTNILPYDISRVKLLPMEDEDGSDYINANWIPGFNSKREFIATQGPLPSTINDFWRMVWENNCQAIVMLTQCIEKGHIKCEQYWPFDKEPVFYGDLKVEIQNEAKTDEWSIVEFQISLGAQTRKLKHFHYVGWPDMYVPEKTSLLAFVHIVRESINTSNSKGSVVVHCSAGVGRTGTFIALDTLLLHIKESHDLDVYGIVFQMRMNRVLMVQTEAQYVFIYECLSQVLGGPTDQVEKIKAAVTNGEMKTETSLEEPNKKESEPKLTSDSKEEQNKKELESKSNRNSKEKPNEKDLDSKSNHDSKEEQNKKDLDSKSNHDSKEEQIKKESESKHNSDSKDEPTKTELELKPNADSKEEPIKKESEPSNDSNEKKINDDTANKPDAEPAKESAKKEEDTDNK